MRLGLTIGYSGAKTALDMPLIEGGRSARLLLGVVRGSLWLGRRHAARLDRGAHQADPRRERHHANAGADAGDDGDDRDDVAACLTFIKPVLALYIGGMGARGKNFYNDLACRYGFEAAAKKIQDLYLDGKKNEANGCSAR